MKKLLFSILFLPVAGRPGLGKVHNATPDRMKSGQCTRPQAAGHRHIDLPGENIAEVRSGPWPINLEKNADGVGTYSLIYRNMEVMSVTSLDTLTFTDLGQLKYFGQALTALKGGHNGDIANFKEYTLSRADKKFDGVWYILRFQEGSTSFQQPEADIMGKTIKGL